MLMFKDIYYFYVVTQFENDLYSGVNI